MRGEHDLQQFVFALVVVVHPELRETLGLAEALKPHNYFTGFEH